jgi:hypothetical protein
MTTNHELPPERFGLIKATCILFAVAVTVRIIIVGAFGVSADLHDERVYLSIATSVVDGVGYVEAHGQAWRPPLYPFFRFFARERVKIGYFVLVL